MNVTLDELTVIKMLNVLILLVTAYIDVIVIQATMVLATSATMMMNAFLGPTTAIHSRHHASIKNRRHFSNANVDQDSKCLPK